MSDTDTLSEDNISKDPDYECKVVDNSLKLESFNQVLHQLGEPPIKIQKLDKFVQKLNNTEKSTQSSETVASAQYCEDLKKSFLQMQTRADKLHYLSTIPSDWGIKKIQNFFNISRRMARKGKKLQIEGIASHAKPKTGRPLSDSLIGDVKIFFLSEDASRVMPGAKDCISVYKDGKRYQEQKHLLLNNLSELHKQFLTNHPQHKISLSKFKKLRPRQCIMADKKGTHNVCVCKIHENVRLKVQGLKQELKNCTTDFPYSYHDLLNQIVCKNAKPECYLRTCQKCPGVSVVRNNLHSILVKHNISQIRFSEWVNTDRSVLYNH